jgi:uncharacterized protein YjiS (DUF1127 family)
MTHHAGTGAFGSTFTLALAGVAVRAVRHLAEALKNRAQVRALNDLDDRALKDIGLLRTDVAAALDAPFHRDPSHHLVDVAGHPRRASKPEAVVAAPRLDRVRRPAAPLKTATA